MHCALNSVLCREVICSLRRVLVWSCLRHARRGGGGRYVLPSKLVRESAFPGNPLEEKHSAEGDWRDQVTRRLSKLKKLDGIPIVGGDEEEEGG